MTTPINLVPIKNFTKDCQKYFLIPVRERTKDKAKESKLKFIFNGL